MLKCKKKKLILSTWKSSYIEKDIKKKFTFIEVKAIGILLPQRRFCFKGSVKKYSKCKVHLINYVQRIVRSYHELYIYKYFYQEMETQSKKCLYKAVANSVSVLNIRTNRNKYSRKHLQVIEKKKFLDKSVVPRKVFRK